MKYVYRNPRPVLTVARAGGGQLGNYYQGTKYHITSIRPLDLSQIKAIRESGVIGSGQEFYVWGQLVDGRLVPIPEKLDWKGRMTVMPSGTDLVECVAVDDLGVDQPGPAINPYSKEPYQPIKESYYTYVIEDRVDSSD